MGCNELNFTSQGMRTNLDVLIDLGEALVRI